MQYRLKLLLPLLLIQLSYSEVIGEGLYGDQLFDYLNDDENLVFEQEPLKQLVSEEELMMYEHDGFWQPMDTSRDYQLLHSLYEDGKAPWI